MHQTLKKRCKFTLRLLDLSNTSFEQNIRLKSLSCLLVIPAIFLSVVSLPTWLTLGYYWRKSLTHLMLISAFELTTFGPKVIRRCWGLHLTECPVGFDHNGITHLATHPKLSKIFSLDLHPDFPKCGNAPIPKTVIAWHFGGL